MQQQQLWEEIPCKEFEAQLIQQNLIMVMGLLALVCHS